MAKIFYVVEKHADYAKVDFFKTEKEALTYGIAEFPDFDMFDEPMEDDENEVWLHGDKLDFKKGILFSLEEGESYIQPMDEDEARAYCNDENSSAMFFDGFKKGMYGLIGNGVDGRGFKWEWDGEEINESIVTEKFNFSKKEVEKAATLIASAISQADMVKAKVHDLEYDKGRGAGFEISIDGEKYAGGSYVVKDNGDVVNAAIGNSHPNAVYNTIGNKDIADVFINMEKYEANSVTEANGQTVKEFGDLLALLLDEDSGVDIERAINAMPPKNARVLEKQISTLYKKLFDLTNQGFDLREDSSVANEAFSRMSKDAIGNELYAASQELSKYYDWLKAGNDSGKGKTLDSVIALLKKCKSSIKRFNKPEEVKGTAFESFVNEAEDYKYKKNVKLAFDTINDEMFKFRHSLGIKTLTNKDMKLKKKVEGLANVIFDLEKEMKAGGLSESKQHSVQTNKINESETVYHKYDFEGMWAQKLGMTREEYVAHFATMTVGVDESTTKDYNGTQFDVKGINFTYTDVGRFYGASLYDVPKTANVSKRAKFSLSEITQFLASIGIKDEVPVRYDTKDLDKICKKLAKKGIVCDHDDFMDVS